MQWQNSVLATPISVADWFNVYFRFGFFSGISGLNPDKWMEFFFVYFFMIANYATSWSLIRKSHAVRVCVCLIVSL
jgi:hypothetical protein